MAPVFVLIPGPLVGPAVWEPVVRELRQRGQTALAPALTGEDGSGLPSWRRHVAAVARALAPLAAETPLLLIGHSGAGASLPSVGHGIGRPLAGYVFVDAHIPAGGQNRLDLLAADHPEVAAELRRGLEAGGRFPTWTDDDLAPLVPDTEIRELVLAEVHPQPLAFFTEPIPVPAGWPDAPCGYLLVSPAYAPSARQARGLGWPVRELPGNHFQMLVDPASVAAALLALVGELIAAPS